MDFTLPNSKKLYLVVEISQLLAKYECTFDEAKDIVSLLTSSLKTQREELEYDTVENCLNGVKTKEVGDEVVVPFKHVEHYC